MDPWMLKKKLFNLLAPMDHSPIPQQEHGSSQVFEQAFEKRSNIQPREIPSPKPEIKSQPFSLRGNRQTTDGRNTILLVKVIKERGLAFRRPSPDNVRDEQETRLIKKHQMGPKFFGFFLYAASDTASNARSPLRSSPEPDVLASDSSTSSPKATSKHGWDDTEYQIASGSLEQSVSGSKDRSDTRQPMDPPGAPAPTSLSERRITWEDGQESFWNGGPWNRPSDTFGTIGRQSFLMLPPSAPQTIDLPCPALAVGWRVGGASPVRLEFHGVSWPPL